MLQYVCLFALLYTPLGPKVYLCGLRYYNFGKTKWKSCMAMYIESLVFNRMWWAAGLSTRNLCCLLFSCCVHIIKWVLYCFYVHGGNSFGGCIVILLLRLKVLWENKLPVDHVFILTVFLFPFQFRSTEILFYFYCIFAITL